MSKATYLDALFIAFGHLYPIPGDSLTIQSQKFQRLLEIHNEILQSFPQPRNILQGTLLDAVHTLEFTIRELEDQHRRVRLQRLQQYARFTTKRDRRP
jgi:hypothetical protein